MVFILLNFCKNLLAISQGVKNEIHQTKTTFKNCIISKQRHFRHFSLVLSLPGLIPVFSVFSSSPKVS